MAAKPKKKPAAKTPAAKRAPVPPSEHRIAISGVSIAVTYGRDRHEQFELRGTAIVNSGSPEEMIRTTGFVAFVSGRARSAGEITHDPASLGRNLVLTVHVDQSDVALLREVFVTGTAALDAPDPSLLVWAHTAQPLATDHTDSQPVSQFGFHLDLDPGPGE